jgi:hypothetical protein
MNYQNEKQNYAFFIATILLLLYSKQEANEKITNQKGINPG